MTISQSLIHADTKLNHLDDHTIIARQLLGHCCKLTQEQLWTYPNQELTRPQQQQFERLVDQAVDHAPLAYLLGYKEFYGRRFIVTPDTLIPRPESEQLINLAVDYFKKLSPASRPQSPVIIDVGTGSGCLAITLAIEIPQATVYAIDTSKAALAIALRNAKLHQAKNITFIQGSLLGPLYSTLAPHSCDIIVANLPYISDQEYLGLPDNVRYFEPKQALVSGPHPDTLNEQLVIQSKDHLKPDALLAYETTNGKIVVV